MVKQSRKKLRRPKRRSFRKRTNKVGLKMVGGTFTQEETEELLGMGFTQDDIHILSNTGVGLNIIKISLTQVNPATGAPFTPQELIQSVNEVNEEMNELDISGISNASDDDHNLDDEYNLDDSVKDSMNTTQDNISNVTSNNSLMEYNSTNDNSLHLSDLENSNIDSTNTTREEDSFGGKRKKLRKTRKSRKSRKNVRKSRKQRGGMCFGNGVGANSYDPNFSIYNTRELSLFPYRPTN